MYKKTIVVVSVSLLLLGAWYFSKNSEGEGTQENSSQIEDSPSVQVAVSIYPLAHFVKKVGGELVKVELITPGGVEPHDYEPKANDIIKIESSRAFIFNGAGVDAWAETVSTNLPQNKNIAVLEMAHFLENGLHKAAEAEEDAHEHGDFDPHIWLDPILAQKQVEYIVQLLVSIDTENRFTYENNASLYLGELTRLHQDYQMKLSHCTHKDIVVSHDAFGYIGSRYGIHIHAIAGLSPEEEPSAARLAELTRLVKEKKLPTVFFETLVSPKLAKTLAEETGATVSVLSPIEGITSKEVEQGKNYDVLMKENLENLSQALVCK